MKKYISLLLLLINLDQSGSILLKGRRVEDGQFPWLIQFQTIAPCGGVLISSDWVLTAAQCVQDKRNSIVLFATGLNGTDTRQTISVKATYIHPHYEPYSILPDRDYNIALMKLTKPFDICNGEVILPNISVKYDHSYTPCLIFGWQNYISSSSKVFAKPIQYSEAVLNSWKLCTYMMKTSTNYTNVFCAMVEFKDEMKACAGNPGSPVVCENPQREAALVGIASWTNFSLECGNFPTYLNLDIFRIWINELIVNNKEIEELENKDRLKEGCQWKENTNYEPKDVKTKLQHVSGAAVSYHATSTEHVAREAINIYNYEEIDKTINSPNKAIISNPIKDELNDRNKSILYNNRRTDVHIRESSQDQSKIDDVEFLLPFNFEDINTSYSRITVVYFSGIHFFYLILLYIYIIIYI